MRVRNWVKHISASAKRFRKTFSAVGTTCLKGRMGQVNLQAQSCRTINEKHDLSAHAFHYIYKVKTYFGYRIGRHQSKDVHLDSLVKLDHSLQLTSM